MFGRKSATEQYADALRQLERMKDSGRIDQAGYEVRRQRLLAESEGPSTLAKLVRIVVIVALAIFVLLLIGNVMQSMG